MIDYNTDNSVIYQIVCIDGTCNSIYTGSTTEFKRREAYHISASANEKYNTKLYETIRNFGGWKNWKMEVIDIYPCEDKNELLIREQHFIDQQDNSLNCIRTHMTKEQKIIYDKERNQANIIRNTKQRKIYRENNKEHIAEQRKKHREENRELIKEQKRKDYEKHKEKRLVGKKKYYEKNKEELLAKNKEHNEKNKEHRAETVKAYALEHQEEIKIYKTNYYEKNKEAILARCKIYRDKKRAEKEKNSA